MTMTEKLTAAIDLYDRAIHALPEGDLEREAAARSLIDTMHEAKKAEAELLDKLAADLILDALYTNGHAAKEDASRNRVNYGSAIKGAEILREMGQEADIACWEDNGYLRISKVTINGKTTSYTTAEA